MACTERHFEEDEMSLYEMCLNVISRKFDLINSVYIKDLPKYILEQILWRLNPFDLEKNENEEFLHPRGISTDLLWKDHFIKGLKSREKVVRLGNFTSWRTEFFKRCFHVLIYEIASKGHVDVDQVLQENCYDLFRHSHGSRYFNISSVCINDILNLSIKHLSTIRVRHNTCVYLVHHQDLLMRLAPVVERLEVQLVRDQGVEPLTRLLDILLNNKLKSLLLLDCNLEDKDSLRALLKALAKSQSLDHNQTCMTTESVMKKLPEKTLFDNGVYFSTSQCETSRINDSNNFYNDVDPVGKQGNTFTSVSESNPRITIRPSEEERCADLGAEDELYDEIFSTRTELEEKPPETLDCFIKPRELEQKPQLMFNQVHPNHLTELKLSSCRIINSCVEVLSEELTSFRSLSSLTVSEVRSCSCPTINYLISSIKELVIHGSLRHLVFEYGFDVDILTFSHKLDMFCDMLMLSCEKCQRTRKGLSSLRVVGGFAISDSMDRFGEKLRTCSFCEKEVFACRTAAGIWFKTKDNTFHSACECLNRGVLECCSTKDVDCDLPKSPVPCRLKKNDMKEVHHDSDAQSSSSESVPARRECLSSNHQYITSGIESLYYNFYTDGGASVLASSLLRNRTLRRISLPRCGLESVDISDIFDCISGRDFHDVNTVIEKLDLRHNTYLPDLASARVSLCNLIGRSHLVSLDLSYCELEVIPDEVVLALSSNKFLQELRIAGNRVGDTGVKQLSQVFTSAEKTSVLNTLDLSCNRLSSCSLLHLAKVLTTWPTKLREISICENPRVETTIVRESLEEVFNVVITEPGVNTAAAYADYLSVM